MSEHRPQPTPTGGPGPMPEPSFQHLVETFAVPALIWTGVLRNPADEEAEPNLELAKYQIGLLEVLEQKCKGNLDAPEQEYIEGMLHNVRMAYVQARKAMMGEAPAADSSSESETEPAPEAKPKIESSDDGERTGLREKKKYDL